MGPYKPLWTWVDEFSPYYMEKMGVDRPWHMSPKKGTISVGNTSEPTIDFQATC